MRRIPAILLSACALVLLASSPALSAATSWSLASGQSSTITCPTKLTTSQKSTKTVVVTCAAASTPTTTAPPTTAAPATTAPPTTAAPTTTAPPTTAAPTTTAPSSPASSSGYPTSWTSFSNGFTEYGYSLHPTQANQLLKGVSIVDSSGNPSVAPDQNGYNGFTLQDFRMQTREGPRAAGAFITLLHGYIEVHAAAGDHSDGVQFYGGGGALIQNTKILAGGDGATGIFAADASHGTITLDGDYFGALPGYNRPGFLVRINADGADQVRVRNSVFECGAAVNGDIAITSSLIVEWTNNTCTDGRVIPKP